MADATWWYRGGEGGCTQEGTLTHIPSAVTEGSVQTLARLSPPWVWVAEGIAPLAAAAGALSPQLDLLFPQKLRWGRRKH